MVIRILCYIIGFSCLYCDFRDMQQPDHMDSTLHDIAPIVKNGVVD